MSDGNGIYLKKGLIVRDAATFIPKSKIIDYCSSKKY